MKADLHVIGLNQQLPRRIAASATRYEYGEPAYLDGATLSSGAASSNTYELMDADGVVIGTDTWGGIFIDSAEPFESGTLTAHTTKCACPIPFIGQMEGKAETAANIDTAAELLAIINDVVLIDYDATGGSDSGELYTIQDTAAADTSAFSIVEGNTSLGTLRVVVDGRAYRIANDIS